MQEDGNRRSNAARTAATRADLIAAARALFTEKTYAGTSTPEIAAAAGVTRGALYHHFADKQALFLAVAEREAEIVAAEIERAAPAAGDPVATLLAGGRAFLEAMRAPGRTRLLLLDGPSVLGRAAMDDIDARHGNRTLREGLVAAMRAGAIRNLPVDALTTQLGALFDRAALAVEDGADAEAHLAVLAALLEGLRR